MISAPSACTASIRHERAGCAVDQHRAGAADAVLAAEVRGGEVELARAGSRPASSAPSTSALRCSPLTVSADPVACSCGSSVPRPRGSLERLRGAPSDRRRAGAGSRRRRVQVAGRLDALGGGGRGRADRLGGRGAADAGAPRRPVSRARARSRARTTPGARRRRAPSVDRHLRDAATHGVVAGAPGDLDAGGAGAGGRGRELDRRQDLVVGDRRGRAWP